MKILRPEPSKLNRRFRHQLNLTLVNLWMFLGLEHLATHRRQN